MEEQLKQLLEKTDDDYLIGLSNKGIVKRAYKDLEGMELSDGRMGAEAAKEEADTEDAVVVGLKDEVCRIRIPLGDSQCSCPSRTLCRHVITAVLWLKERYKAETGSAGKDGTGDTGKSPGEHQPGTADAEAPAASKETGFPELLAMPLDKLRRSCKNRYYREMLAHVQAGDWPPPEESSVVTVFLPWEQVTVKLLEPLAHSACSCHSRELCSHKAQALLLYQLHKGVITLAQLNEEGTDGVSWDKAELLKTAGMMKEAIRLQLVTGLSRLSPEMTESMERMAVISHRSGLADYESRFRELVSEYTLYFEHAAVFDAAALLRRLLRLYRMAEQLETAAGASGGEREISRLAGSFRDEYRPQPGLSLMGIGSRYFKSKNGYEGESYYFLETKQQKWYTWTDARPVFYEGQKRKYYGNTESSQAPWGLGCSREHMLKLEFTLLGAKATKDRKLSVSKDTRSEIKGKRLLTAKVLEGVLYDDYALLLKTLFVDGMAVRRAATEQLALVAAEAIRDTHFDPISQTFGMTLLDRKRRGIMVEVRYTEAEKLTIQVLERLDKRLKSLEQKPPIFFCRVYLDEGKLKLYPIDFFEMDDMDEVSAQTSADRDPDMGTAANNGEYPDAGRLPANEFTEGINMQRLLKDIRDSLEDLFQSGLNSVQPEVIAHIRKLAAETASMGLHGAGRLLKAVGQELAQRLHQMEADDTRLLQNLTDLNRYLEYCSDKIQYDLAEKHMGQAEAEVD